MAIILELNFSTRTSNEYSWLISFRIDWLDLPAVQRTLKSLLQHHNSKASIQFKSSAFFMVQLLHLYMTTGKPIDLTIWTLVGKVISMPFNMLSSFVIALLPRSKHLLISWVQSTIGSDFGTQENKTCHCFHFSPSICHEVIGLDAKILPWLYWGPQNCFGLGRAQHLSLWQEPKTEPSLYEKLR